MLGANLSSWKSSVMEDSPLEYHINLASDVTMGLAADCSLCLPPDVDKLRVSSVWGDDSGDAIFPRSMTSTLQDVQRLPFSFSNLEQGIIILLS